MSSAFNTDPFRLGGNGYLLDQIPTVAMAQAMQKIWYGDKIVLPRSGKGFVWLKTDEPVSSTTVKALLTRQWLIEPSFPLPLFGDHRAGTLTVRGEHALNRFNFG